MKLPMQELELKLQGGLCVGEGGGGVIASSTGLLYQPNKLFINLQMGRALAR